LHVRAAAGDQACHAAGARQRQCQARHATNIKQCLAIEVPAFVAFYRASADYSGADDFELEISLPNGHKRRERFHMTVTKSSSGAGEGI
jgi:hypothetical protein